MSPSTVTPIAVRRNATLVKLDTSCAGCASRGLCWAGDAAADADWYAQLQFVKRKVKRGAALYRMGEAFENLYAIRSGCFKTSVLLEDGREQVTSFKMSGDMLGLDGIASGEHMSDAVALEDSEVCVIAYVRVMALWRQTPALASELNRMLSREIAGDQSAMAMLGTMQAQERVVMFLLQLAQRFKARGYSGTEFVLRMTREEIGSYLSLKLETVSRILSRLQAQGLIEIEQNRNVLIRDLERMRAEMTPAFVMNAAQRCACVRAA